MAVTATFTANKIITIPPFECCMEKHKLFHVLRLNHVRDFQLIQVDRLNGNIQFLQKSFEHSLKKGILRVFFLNFLLGYDK